MAANRIDPWFWRHAYMLEFRETDKFGFSLKTESFTFSLPPESEQITQTQRVNYTKTFGGVVVDDYGNDVFKITLSGTTGNSDKKTIFRGTVALPKSLTGEEEILFLGKTIERYGQLDMLENKRVYLFDLSKTNLTSLITSPNYWQVNIDSFRYQRDKSNPTFYKYTLEMTAYRPERKFWYDWQNDFSDTLDYINIALESINEIFGTVEALVDLCTILVEDTASLQTVYENYKNLIQGKISQTVNTYNEVIALGEWVKSKTSSSSSSSDDTDEDSEETTSTTDNNDTNVDFQNTIDELKTDFTTFKTTTETKISEMSDEIAQTIINQQGLTSRDEFESLVACMLDDMQNQVDKLAAQIKQMTKIAYFKGYIYYGKKEVVATSTDTYESISLREYGSIDYADEIATFNDGKDISAGSVIIVPILTERESITGNEVIKAYDDLDEYGKDIALDDNGDIAINYSNGDIKISESDENIEQAIVSRISTEMGTRIRDTAYGIKSTIGGSNAVTAFLYSSIHETVMADPRIDDVDSIEFEGNGDNLNYTINYTTKLGEENTVRGNV